MYEGILLDIGFAGFFLSKVNIHEARQTIGADGLRLTVATPRKPIGWLGLTWPRPLQRPDLPQTLHRQPRRPSIELHCGHRRSVSFWSRPISFELTGWPKTEFGITKMVDLIPNGSNITVTRENRLDYIQRISHYRLSTQIRKQSNAFFEGLKNVIDSRWIRSVFIHLHLQRLLNIQCCIHHICAACLINKSSNSSSVAPTHLLI